MARIGCFPGSFNPLTIAHIAIADAAVSTCGLDRLDMVLSRVALAKEGVERPLLDDRVDVIRRAADTRPWLGAVVTDAQLLVDVSRGYDTLVLGADKWQQVLDPKFYGGSDEARDAAVEALPPLAIAHRKGTTLELPPGAVRLPVADWIQEVSSTGARGGTRAWMAHEAMEFDDLCGAWSDEARYERWLALRATAEGS